MVLSQVINQTPKSFFGIYKCENCGHEHEGSGINDWHFVNCIMPTFKCQNCDMNTIEININKKKNDGK
jgi:hypothetical protein